MSQAQRRDKGSLLQMVYAKIEKEFGLEKQFSHWDFEECLGADKSKDRNRISVRLKFFCQHGVLLQKGEGAQGKRKKHSIYQVVSFPLSVVKQVDKQAAFGQVQDTSLDNIFFNLGRKKNETKNDLQLIHRATELANIKSLKEGNAVILKGTK